MDAALAQAWDIGSISFQIDLLFVYLFQIRLCSGAAPGSVHLYGNPFHNIVGLVKLSDNTVYQFPLAEAEPGPDLSMYMIAVAEVLVIQAAFCHCKKFCPVAIFPYSLVYLKAMHLRDVAFLLVLEDDSIPFNRYNLRLYWLFIRLLFYECFFVSLCLLTGIILE